MECTNCKAVWQSDKKEAFCPFCGEDIRDAKEKAKDHAGFDYTWGLMHEDTLKRSKGPVDVSLRDQALESFLKAVQENPNDALHTAQFLQTYPQESRFLEQYVHDHSQAWMPWNALSLYQQAICLLLFRGVQAGSTRCALRLVDSLHQFLQESPQNIPDKQLEELTGKLFSTPVEYQELMKIQAAAYALTGHNQDACKAMKEAYDPQGISALDWNHFQAYTGAAPDLEGRLSQIDQAVEEIQTKGLDNLLCLLYRPLQEEDHAFDHLQSAMPKVLPVLMEHQDEWFARTRQFLQQEAMLRGIHLVLQQANSTHKGIPEIDDLLHRHYIKVYLKPYEWIRSTDFKLTA